MSLIPTPHEKALPDDTPQLALPLSAEPDLSRPRFSADGRTVLCGACARPSLLCQDERSGLMGYTCRDHGCPGSRVLARRARA